MEGISVVPTDYEWYTPSYEKLLTHKLLRTDWRVQSIDELQFRDGNATPGANMLRKMLCMVFPPAACFLNTALVPTGSVRMMEDGRAARIRFSRLAWVEARRPRILGHVLPHFSQESFAVGRWQEGRLEHLQRRLLDCGCATGVCWPRD